MIKFKINNTEIFAEDNETIWQAAKKNNIEYELVKPKKSSFIIKSYADNFLKD